MIKPREKREKVYRWGLSRPSLLVARDKQEQENGNSSEEGYSPEVMAAGFDKEIRTKPPERTTLATGSAVMRRCSTPEKGKVAGGWSGRNWIDWTEGRGQRRSRVCSRGLLVRRRKTRRRILNPVNSHAILKDMQQPPQVLEILQSSPSSNKSTF